MPNDVRSELNEVSWFGGACGREGGEEVVACSIAPAF